MTIATLDEAQGLTKEMVLAWLASKGWVPEESRELAQWWISPRGLLGHNGAWIPHDDHLTEYPLAFIAARYKMTLQQLLRDINPRLRAGWPSDEALAAHPKLWLVSINDRDKFETLTAAVLAEWKARARFTVRCWPCDQYAQRVRWPERNGVIL